MNSTPSSTPAAALANLPEVLDAGDGVVYPASAGLKAAAQLFKAMQALHGSVHSDHFANVLSELLGGSHWHATADQLIDELEANPGLLGVKQ